MCQVWMSLCIKVALKNSEVSAGLSMLEEVKGYGGSYIPSKGWRMTLDLLWFIFKKHLAGLNNGLQLRNLPGSLVIDPFTPKAQLTLDPGPEPGREES